MHGQNHIEFTVYQFRQTDKTMIPNHLCHVTATTDDGLLTVENCFG